MALDSPKWNRLWPWIAALLSMALVTSVFWLIDRSENAAYRAGQRQQLQEYATNLRNKIEMTMAFHYGALDTLNGLVSDNGDFQPEVFKNVGKVLSSNRPAVLMIQLSPDAIVSYAYPPGPGRKVLGVDLRQIPGQAEMIRKQAADGQVRTIGPLRLVFGGEGVIVSKPVYTGEGDNREFWGLAAIILNFDSLLSRFNRDMHTRAYTLAIRDLREERVFFGDRDLFRRPGAKVIWLDIPGALWQMAIARESGPPTLRPHAWFARALGLLIVLAIGALAWLSVSRSLALSKRANIDSLTGALTRPAFEEAAEEELERTRRYALPAALIVFDLDHFKAINDTHGHAGGDAVLRAVGALVRKRLRTNDLFGRTGGEEFAIMLPHSTGEQATKVAESLRTEIEALRIPYRRSRIPVTASFGILRADTEGDDEHDLSVLLRAADNALYRAKADGRNRVIAGHLGTAAHNDDRAEEAASTASGTGKKIQGEWGE